MMYSLNEYITAVLKELNREDLEIGITFELQLDELCRVVDGGLQKIKFSCKSK